MGPEENKNTSPAVGGTSTGGFGAPSGPISSGTTAPGSASGVSSPSAASSPAPTIADLANAAAEKAAYEEEVANSPDIVIAKDKKPLNKKLIAVLAILVLVVAGTAAAVVLTMGNGGSTPSILSGGNGNLKEIKEKLEELREYAEARLVTKVEEPEAETEENQDNDVAKVDEEDNASEAPYVGFFEKYKEFKDVADKASDKVKASIGSDLTKLNAYVTASQWAVDPESLRMEAIETYKNGSEEDLKSFAESISNLLGQEDPLHQLLDEESNYVIAVVEQYLMAKEVNCLEDDAVNINCLFEAYGTDNQEYVENVSDLAQGRLYMDNYVDNEVMGKTFLGVLEEIEDKLGAIK